MPAPAVYPDECVAYKLGEALRKRGFFATTALDEGRAGQGLGDEDQLAYATAQDWVLITTNAPHFRLLHAAWQQQGKPHGGILILPESPPFERLVIRVALALTWLATLPEYRSRFFTWGQLQAFLEQGYRPAGFDKDESELALGRRAAR